MRIYPKGVYTKDFVINFSITVPHLPMFTSELIWFSIILVHVLYLRSAALYITVIPQFRSEYWSPKGDRYARVAVHTKTFAWEYLAGEYNMGTTLSSIFQSCEIS